MVTMTVGRRGDTTRELLLRTSERLFAERGLAAVSIRQIVEAAGQANNSALAYHVGSRADLITAIRDGHAEAIVGRTEVMVAAARDAVDPRDHVACLVLPYTGHLAELGNPSWYARLAAQLAADPTFSAETRWDRRLSTLIRQAVDALGPHLPALDPAVAAVRDQAVRVAILHTCAEQERAAADTGVPADWTLIGHALTDAVAGLLLAPARDAAPSSGA